MLMVDKLIKARHVNNHFDTGQYVKMIDDLQNLKFPNTTSVVTNVTNASNIVYSRQIPIQIGKTIYYLMLDTAAR